MAQATLVKINYFTDRLSEGTLKTIIENTPKAIEHPESYAPRSQIMWASTVAHNDLLGTGREEDWASHKIEHELSGMFDVTHGAGLAITFPAWMKYNYQKNVERFAQFAVRVWNVDPDFFSPDETALQGIHELESFYESIGLPTRLGHLEEEISEDEMREMAAKCTEDGPVGNFVELNETDVLKIYKLAQ